jgi:hypothetical protein
MRSLVILIVGVICIGFAQTASALNFSPISDIIVSSAPTTASTTVSTSHLISFTTSSPIPASGTITITPEGAFTIPAAFDFTDVDVSVSNGGPFVDRDLASAASGSEDGVSVVTGSSGSITITLSSGSGIGAGSIVHVILGSGATHQAAADVSPINPSTVGSYRIRVVSRNGGTQLEAGTAMIAIIRSVTTSTLVNDNAPIVSDALPTGLLPGGTTAAEISFTTNVAATCRYATSSGIAYGGMTHNFTSVGGQLFYGVVTGLADNTSYSYFIRCRDLFGATAQSDYQLDFSVGITPSITTSDGNTPGGGTLTAPSGSGGSGGVGPFAGGSALLFQSSATLTGKAPANSSVSILKDGTEQKVAQASSDGTFTATISGLERGTYTFVTFATIGDKKTSRFSSTITLNSGTNNGISGILLSPTIAPDAETVDVGSDVRVSGAGVPNTQVGILIRDVPKSGQTGTSKEYTASTTASGAWEFTIPAKDLKRGSYDIRVKTIGASASSEYSPSSYVGYGEVVDKAAANGNRSDINRDGKVNLVDFSILLTHWNESDDDADINQDGTVNLSDFSILLFNWTG